MATDRLIRETDPPSGLLASPVPQVWDPTADNGQGAWTRVYGEHNATRVLIYGPNGQPISAVNRLPVDAAISGAVDVSDRANRVLGQATVSGTVDVSDRANRALGQVTLTGHDVPDNEPIPVKTITQAHMSWNLRGMTEVTIAPGASISDTPMIPVNGYGRLIVLVRDISQQGNKKVEIRVRWQTESGAAKPLRSAIEILYNDNTDSFGTVTVETTTKSQYVSIIVFNRDTEERTYHVHGMMTIS